MSVWWLVDYAWTVYDREKRPLYQYQDEELAEACKEHYEHWGGGEHGDSEPESVGSDGGMSARRVRGSDEEHSNGGDDDNDGGVGVTKT